MKKLCASKSILLLLICIKIRLRNNIISNCEISQPMSTTCGNASAKYFLSFDWHSTYTVHVTLSGFLINVTHAPSISVSIWFQGRRKFRRQKFRRQKFRRKKFRRISKSRNFVVRKFVVGNFVVLIRITAFTKRYHLNYTIT